MTAIALSIAGPDLAGAEIRRTRGEASGGSRIAILNGHGTDWRSRSSGGAFSIKWAAKGAIRYRVDGGARLVGPGGLMLVNDSQPYEMDFQGAGQSFCLFYSRDLVEAAGGPLGEFPNLAFRPGFGAEVARLHSEIGADGRWPEDIETRLLLILDAAVTAAREHRGEAARLRAAKPTTRRHLRARLEVARALITEGEGGNLDQVARASGLSKFHLLRLFRQAFGTTPMRYAEGLRLDRAAKRLRVGGGLVEEIAFEAGYDSLSAFGRAFRRRFGASPTAWRKAMRN